MFHHQQTPEDGFFVHWDEKSLSDIIGQDNDKVNRLPVVITREIIVNWLELRKKQHHNIL